MQAVTQRRGLAQGGTALHSRPFAPARPVARRALSVQAAATKGSRTSSSKRTTVVPEPSLNVPLGALALSGVSAFAGVEPLAWFTGILGVFLAFQSTRVRFQFEEDALEVVIAGKEEKETENAFVGGRNRWRYDTFVNWEMWWPGFPILVYFKETQTKAEGQIHFFPIIFNGKQLYDVMVERCGPSQNSGPK